MTEKLQQLGGAVALAGIASIILALIDYNLRVLMWIDLWGTGAGWAIRVGLVVLGGVLFFVGAMGAKPEAEGAGE
jgi:hypothetical protein